MRGGQGGTVDEGGTTNEGRTTRVGYEGGTTRAAGLYVRGSEARRGPDYDVAGCSMLILSAERLRAAQGTVKPVPGTDVGTR